MGGASIFGERGACGRVVLDEYRRHRPEIELLPDAAACLQRIAPIATTAFLTDGPVDSQRMWLIIGLMTIAAPVAMLVLRRFLVGSTASEPAVAPTPA